VVTLSLLLALLSSPACDPVAAAATDRARLVHVWFDERFYLTRYSDVEASVRRCAYRSGFDHFLLHGAVEQRDPTPWYDEGYYLQANPDVAEAVRKGVYGSGFEHYLIDGMRERRDPSPWFSESFYLQRYPDVARAIRKGEYLSGAEHFALVGLSEGRDPVAWFDERMYLRRYLEVASAVAAGKVRSGFEHYILYGRTSGYLPVAVSPNAVQRTYLRGVPQTDRQGSLRATYDSGSFFPRCIYHAVAGSFQTVAAAGFNCAHVWEGHGVGDVIEEARTAHLQLIRHWPTDEEVRRFGTDPNILGWYLDEEPVAQTYLEMERTGNRRLMEERYHAFLARKSAIKSMDSRHPVFTLGTAWVPPGLDDWWARWESSGDVAAHDNYALTTSATDFADLGGSVTRAVRLNHERKPVWVALQAFTGTADRASSLRMPTPAELRGMAFTAVVHGATGLIFFAYDSWVTRDGLVIGVGPSTPERYGARSPATPQEVTQSRALWAGLRDLNEELERLTPWLLSPTARVSYTVQFSGECRTPDPIRAVLKERDGEFALLVANIERGSMVAGFRFGRSLASVMRQEADGRQTPIPTEGSTFQDGLGAFGAATYLIRFR
jgi:hypothetical protein